MVIDTMTDEETQALILALKCGVCGAPADVFEALFTEARYPGPAQIHDSYCRPHLPKTKPHKRVRFRINRA